MFSFLRSCLENNGKITAGGFIICHRNVRIMIFGDDTAKVETQSRTLLFSGSFISEPVKPREDFFLFLIGDARPFVTDLQFDP